MPHCSPSRERREAALAEIGQCVLQDRNASYGDPEDNFQDIADRWSVLFRGRGVTFTPADVAAMMCDVKLARLRTSMGKADNWVDLAGYAVCGYSVTQQPVETVEPAQQPAGGIRPEWQPAIELSHMAHEYCNPPAKEPKADDPTSFEFLSGDIVRHSKHGEGTVEGCFSSGVFVDFNRNGKWHCQSRDLTLMHHPGKKAAYVVRTPTDAEIEALKASVERGVAAFEAKAPEIKAEDPNSFVFKVGDRVNHDVYGEGTVTGNIGYGLSVTYDSGRKSSHPKRYLTFLSRPGEEA